LKSKNISILGNGWLGNSLAKNLALEFININVSNRKEHCIFEKTNINHFFIDIDNMYYKDNNFFNCNVLIINIPSKNIKAFRYLIEKIEKSSIQNIIFVSSTSVYNDINATIKESDNYEDKDKVLYQIEQLFLKNKSFNTTIIRFGGLLGYGRHPGAFFKNKIVKNANAYVNMIYRDDCINIIFEIIKQNKWNETFNCCATTHPTKKEFYTYSAKQLDINLEFEENITSSYKIISNEKVKDILNYKFKYPDLLKIIY